MADEWRLLAAEELLCERISTDSRKELNYRKVSANIRYFTFKTLSLQSSSEKNLLPAKPKLLENYIELRARNKVSAFSVRICTKLISQNDWQVEQISSRCDVI